MRMVVCRCDASSDRGVRCPPEVGRVGRGRIGIGSARRVRVGHVARQEQDGDGGDGLGSKTQRGLLYSSPDGRGGSRSDKVSIGGTAATSDVHFVRRSFVSSSAGPVAQSCIRPVVSILRPVVWFVGFSASSL